MSLENTDKVNTNARYSETDVSESSQLKNNHETVKAIVWENRTNMILHNNFKKLFPVLIQVIVPLYEM